MDCTNTAIADTLNAINRANLGGAAPPELWQELIEEYFATTTSDADETDSDSQSSDETQSDSKSTEPEADDAPTAATGPEEDDHPVVVDVAATLLDDLDVETVLERPDEEMARIDNFRYEYEAHKLDSAQYYCQ